MEFSYFNRFHSNEPNLCTANGWEGFIKDMRIASEVEGYKPAASDYTAPSSGLISPAIYGNDTDKRKNDNVIGWDIICMDIDTGVDELDVIIGHFSKFTNLIYSSPNCTHEKLKLRVILPLDKRAPKEYLKNIWHACEQWCNGIVDVQTKDISRLYYVPARYTNRGEKYRHFFLTNDGMSVNWEQLIKRYPYKVVEKFNQKNPLQSLKRSLYVQNHGTPSLNIHDKTSGLVYQNMIDDYKLTPAGSHHKAIYLFMVKVCYNAQKIGYPIVQSDLVYMARQLDDEDGGYYDDKKLNDSAGDALTYVI